MLNEFLIWLSKHGKYSCAMNRHGLSESVVIDFENEFTIARFTVWNDLSSMSEVMDVESGKFLIDERKDFSSIYELINIFERFE